MTRRRSVPVEPRVVDPHEPGTGALREDSSCRVRRAVLFAGLSILLLCCSSWPDPNAPSVTLSHVRGPVYVAEDSFYAKENSVVFVGERAVTVVGATWTPETARRLHREIRRVTSLPVEEVVLTNHHPDRAGGSEYWASVGARVVCTHQTAALLVSEWPALLVETRSAFPSFPDLAPVVPAATFPGDFALQDGRIRAFYLGPSHTTDGIFVHFPEQRVLYGGCILKERLGSLAHADVDQYPHTLRRLQSLGLDFDLVIAGHWSPLHGPGLIDDYLELLDRHVRGADQPQPDDSAGSGEPR